MTNRLALPDGCSVDHTPGSNPGCDMAPAAEPLWPSVDVRCLPCGSAPHHLTTVDAAKFLTAHQACAEAVQPFAMTVPAAMVAEAAAEHPHRLNSYVLDSLYRQAALEGRRVIGSVNVRLNADLDAGHSGLVSALSIPSDWKAPQS